MSKPWSRLFVAVLPVHVLEQGADVQEIVNMAAVAVIDAQWRVRAGSDAARVATGEHETLAATH